MNEITNQNNQDLYRVIQIPIHPDDQALPLSTISIKLPSGKVASATFPIQGEKTIDGMLALLEIWKPTLVIPDSRKSQPDNLEPTEIYLNYCSHELPEPPRPKAGLR